ncbi:hypothetical protein F8280_30955 [Micromonospora noduli]|uniref:hypothetical protein n=1 Tax=Micromonospora noduli TaxID=709876 RepID=UPI00124B23D4|nr:hypothetical protein [Micromonospora noduli]KAB1916509.1 hypothetical protein F8280_30955 [Micromonospora noduli]
MSVPRRPIPGGRREPPGHDFVCASPPPAVRPARGPSSRHPEPSMSRYVAPLGFTLAAVWVAIVFVLAGGGH